VTALRSRPSRPLQLTIALVGAARRPLALAAERRYVEERVVGRPVDPVCIEPYRPQHARPLVELWRTSFEHGVGITDPHPLEAQLAFFEEKVLLENKVRIAFSASTLVGFIASTPESIAQLYVAVPFIGRGIGSQLLALAKSESSGSLWLYTFVCNARARAFYERHGFKDSGHGYENMWNLEDIKYSWSRSASAA